MAAADDAECRDCGGNEFKWEADGACYCAECGSTQTHIRREHEEDLVAGTRDRKAIVRVGKDPTKCKRPGLHRRELAASCLPQELWKKASKVLIEMSRQCASHLSLDAKAFLGEVRVFWVRWMRLATNDPACCSFHQRLLDPPCNTQKLRETNCVTGAADMYRAHQEHYVNIQRTWRRETQMMAISPSMVMGFVVPPLTKDLLLALLWMCLVNFGVAMLPVDVARWLVCGPLHCVLEALEEALPSKRQDNDPGAEMVLPTGPTIQTVAAQLVRIEGFFVNGVHQIALVRQLVGACVAEPYATMISKSVYRMLLLAEKLPAKAKRGDEEPFKQYFDIAFSESANSNGFYVYCGLHRERPMYQRVQCEGSATYLYFATIQGGTGWHAAAHPHQMPESSYEYWPSSTNPRGHSTWSLKTGCSLQSGRGSQGGEMRPTATKHHLPPGFDEKLTGQDCCQVEVCLSTRGADGVYSFCGQTNGLPMFMRDDRSGPAMFLFYHKTIRCGWIIGRHPDVFAHHENDYLEFWGDINLSGEHGGFAKTQVVEDKRSLNGYATQASPIPHAFAPFAHQTGGYIQDIFAAGAIMAAAEIHGCFLPVKNSRQQRANDTGDDFPAGSACMKPGQNDFDVDDDEDACEELREARDALRSLLLEAPLEEHGEDESDSHAHSNCAGGQGMEKKEEPPLIKENLQQSLALCIRGCTPHEMAQLDRVKTEIECSAEDLLKLITEPRGPSVIETVCPARSNQPDKLLNDMPYLPPYSDPGLREEVQNQVEGLVSSLMGQPQPGQDADKEGWKALTFKKLRQGIAGQTHVGTEWKRRIRKHLLLRKKKKRCVSFGSRPHNTERVLRNGEAVIPVCDTEAVG